MTWPQAVIVYFVCWWLLMFIALPIGIERDDNPALGASRAAPKKGYLFIKCVSVTLLAVLATWGIDLLLSSGIVAVR